MKAISELLALAALLLSGHAAAQPSATPPPKPCSGTVFLDRNANGLRDRGERPLRGIPVSNGDTVVMTDRHGRFTLPLAPHGSVFPILPAEYDFPGGAIRNARFRYFAEVPQSCGCDFGLVRRDAPARFSIAAVGDVQFGDSLQAGYAARSFFSEAAAERELDFALFLGDQVNDNCEMLELFASLAGQLPMASWTLPGNHDRDMDSIRTLERYNTLFGADTYAFNHGEVHFVVFNNVLTQGRRGYTGRLTERQLRFLRNDLRQVPQERLVVIAQHIPMSATENRAEVLSLLEGRRCLILSGHAHATFRTRHSAQVQELTAGAVCGLLWTGEEDLDGVPLSLQPCGTPRNYFRIDFDGDGYRFRFKGIGLDASRQADVWIAGSDPEDRSIEELAALPRGTVVVNLFAGGPDTEVRMQLDEGPWQTLTRAKIPAPSVLRSRQRQRLGLRKPLQAHPSPHRATPSPHVWMGQLPADTAPGAHTLRLEARDTTSDAAVRISDTRVIVTGD